MERLNILAIAYACSPLHGSEFGVGWGWVNAIAERHNVTVITADFNAVEITQNIAGRVKPTRTNPRFLYVTNRPWHYKPSGVWPRIENSFAKPLMNMAYQNWLGYAFAKAKQELESNRYDLVHLITYVGWRFSGRFHELGIPFVWGPIGGLKNTPWNLFPALGLKGAVYFGGRNIINSLQIRLLSGPRRALRHAQGAVIAATSEIQDELQRHFGSNSQVICEVGIPNVAPVTLKRRKAGEPLRICWSGVHQPGKALHILLRASARLSKGTIHSIHILGDGPSNREWRSLAKSLGIGDHCVWYGLLPRNRALQEMQMCHLLAITSLKELTSTVAIEALSLGLPVVCLDHCGLADLITSDCGIKIPPRNIHQITAGFAEAITQLNNDESRRWNLAHGALERSRQYSWGKKAELLDEVYLRAIKLQRPPELFGPR